MAQNIDENGNVLTGLDAYRVAIAKPGPFIGGTVDARGDHDGASDPTTLFTVTGDVLVRIYGVCTTTNVGSGGISVGVEDNVAGLIVKVANAGDLIEEEIFVDSTPTDVGVGLLSTVLGPYLVVNGNDIIETLDAANITAGEVYYICLWKPVTPDGKVVGLSA